jgi:uncharacterized protein (DUF924 family)
VRPPVELVSSAVLELMADYRSFAQRRETRSGLAAREPRPQGYCPGMSDVDSVLDFWFGAAGDEAAVVAEKGGLWWAKSAEMDQTIRDRFGELRERAKRGQLVSWNETPRGRLAVIILLDQFSRNLFRGIPEAFAADDRALSLALEGIERGDDQELRGIERTFMYMPLEHSEDVEIQDRCVRLFENLRDGATDSMTKTFASYVRYAEAHRDIIQRFGRFPHRNAVLGRQSTAEELEFLKQPGSSF